MRLWWYNNVHRHFWMMAFNWRYPRLPRIKVGRMTKENLEWARQAFRAMAKSE